MTVDIRESALCDITGGADISGLTVVWKFQHNISVFSDFFFLFGLLWCSMKLLSFFFIFSLSLLCSFLFFF